MDGKRLARWAYTIIAIATGIYAVPADPCNEHHFIANAEKRNALYRPENPLTAIRFCDLILEPGWYRVRSEHGTDMPTSAPEVGACNTGYPIWLNGSLPQPGDGVVDRIACKVKKADNCSETFNIQIKNCGVYNVYNLIPTSSCPVGYCFGDKQQCPPGEFSEDGFLPGCSDDFPNENVTTLVVPEIGQLVLPGKNLEQVMFECHIKQPVNSTYYVDVYWIINGLEIQSYKRLEISEVKTRGALPETAWRDKFRLGFMVQCAVRIRYSKDRIPGPKMTSAEFFAGIKVLTPEIAVEEGKSVELRFRPTLPITCDKDAPPFICGLFVASLEDTKESIAKICDGGDEAKLTPENCGFRIPGGRPVLEQTMTVNTDTDDDYRDKVSQILLVGTQRAGFDIDIWKDVQLQTIWVNVHDSDYRLTGKRCTSLNDPHMKTFDGRKYELQLPGEFVLYRHKVLPVEVHTFYEASPACSKSSNIFCNCGVAVQSSDDVFVIDRCGGKRTSFRPARIQKYGCSNNQMSISRINNGFEVLLITGTKVFISDNGLLNIEIEPTTADLGQTEGLCGLLNNYDCDDFIGSDGTRYYLDCKIPEHPNTFSISWRVRPGDVQSSLFGGKPVSGRAVQTIPSKCTCKPNENGKFEATLECNEPPIQCNNADVTALFSRRCTQLGGRRRRKRDIEDLDLDYEDDEEYIFTYDTKDTSEIPDWSNGWTEEKARQFCSDYFNQSATFQACKAVPNIQTDFSMDACILDIQYTGETEWALNALESYKSDCTSEVRKNFTLREPNPNMPNKLSIFEVIKDVTCPNECHYHGKCLNGTCECEPEWMGEDCSSPASQQAEVFGTPRNGMCDLSLKPCTATIVYGQNFVNTQNLKCRIRTIQTRASSQNAQSIVMETAIFKFAEEVICPIPFLDEAELNVGMKTPQSMDIVPFTEIDVVGFMISVANNDTFSQEVLFLPHDKTCVNCSLTENKPYCRLQRDYCYIEDMCYQDGEANPDNTSEGCDVHVSNRHWSSMDITLSTGYPPTTARAPISLPSVTILTLICSSFLTKTMTH